MDLYDDFRHVSSSLQTLNSLAQSILWTAVGASVLILGLLIMLFLRERRHEIGIYLALGERKRGVITQMVLEVLMVAFAAIALSLVIGNIFANSISEDMLRTDIVAAQRAEQSMTFSDLDYLGFSPGESAEEMLLRYDTSLNMVTALLFFAVGIGATLMATIAPMFYIVRLNPKRIFEVIGIYRLLAKFDTASGWDDEARSADLSNRIYVPNKVAAEAFAYHMEARKAMQPYLDWQPSDFEVFWGSTYLLRDVRDIDNFRTVVEDMTSNTWTAFEPDDGLGSILVILDSLSDLAIATFWISTISAAAVLGVLLVIIARSKRKEMRDYLIQGGSKSRLALYMGAGILTITFLAGATAIPVGYVLASKASENYIVAGLNARDDAINEYSSSWTLELKGIPGATVNAEDVLAAYDSPINATTILSFFAVSIAVVTIATVIPVLYILRLNPKKALMQ